MNVQEQKNNLAKIAVTLGVNIQPGQYLMINSPVETADFARSLAKAAFEAGAGDVYINYSDEDYAKLRYTYADSAALADIPEWWRLRLQDFLERGGCVISIAAGDPDLMREIDADKIAAAVRARQAASADYSRAMMVNDNRWCVISAATQGWAKKVFPDSQNPTAQLWDAILSASGADTEDPVAAWRKKDETFKRRARWLNEKQFESLRYTNARGTDLTVGLPKNHVWSGGSETARDGVRFFPNLPTEEIFTAPDRSRVNGRVVASYPLSYQGKNIEDFELTFKDGKVVDVRAGRHEDMLRELIKNDGADYLGEVALVPYDSAISNLNLLFYNTLFDENAACHLALGDAYPGCVQGGEDMSAEELLAHGLNQSQTHVDFMIGTKDLSITGIGADGSETPVFVNGNFAPEIDA